MVKNKFNKNLINMIENSTSSYKTIYYLKEQLLNSGYSEIYEKDKWNISSGKYFVIRNDASIISFEIPKNYKDVFHIITTHSDTPSLLLKPSGEYTKSGYLKYNVMPYGGLLNYGWLDHPLSVSGRIIYKDKDVLKKKIIDLKDTLFVIPSVAIHQNDKANSNLDLNMQVDLQPIYGLEENNVDFIKYISNKYNIKNIIDYDLYLYNNSKPQVLDISNDLLLSPRIDNLTSVYAALESFLESKSSNIKVFCSFNNEEIGSLTEEGADSNFLIDVLKRICSSISIDISISLYKSIIVSSDNTHAVHPNHDEYTDDTGKVYLGKGVAIIKETTSTTNALSSSIIKTICNLNNVKYQDSTTKNDLTGGSTLSGISLRHLSALSIDIGAPQLAMHSSTELCSLSDIYELYKLMKSFYESSVVIKNDEIIIYNGKNNRK